MATIDRLQGYDIGVAVKPPCAVASTGNITLSSTQVIDGIAVGSCERVLVRAQTNAKENGIYEAGEAAWRRTADFDGKRDAIPGTQVYVDRGNTFGRVFFAANSSSTAISIDIGATGDDVTWSQITPSVTDVSAGTVIASGSTAERALDVRFAEKKNVLDWTPLASTDDWSPAFTAAINSVSSDAGLIVKVPVQDYPCKTGLPARSNVWIQGDGEGSFLDFSGSSASVNAFEFAGAAIDDFRLSDMRIRGASQDTGDAGDTGANGVYIDSTAAAERIKIHDVRIERFRQGVFIKSDSVVENPEVTNCFIDECSQTGIRMQNCKWFLIEGNTLDCDRTGIGDSTGTVVGISVPTALVGEECEFGRIANNSVRSGSQEAIIVQGKHITVIGNTVDTPGAAGIVVESPKNASTAADGKLYCTVTGNTVSGSTAADGVRLQHDPANNAVGVGYNVVSNNTVLGCNIGIRVGQAGSTDQAPFDNSVIGNVVVGTAGRAIDVDDSVGTVIQGNKVIGSGGAAVGITGTAARTSVIGGYLNATGTDADGVIILESVTDTLISGVTFANCNRYGVRVSGTPVDVIVTGNFFIDDQGTPTMDSAVSPTALSQNVQVWGNYSQGTTATAYAGNIADPQEFQIGNRFIYVGSSSPEGVVAADIGSVFLRTDGSTLGTFYVKEQSTGNTGWFAK